MKPINLSDLIEALEFESDEYTNRVDLENGCVVRLPNSLLSSVEDGDEDSLDDWEPEEVEIARAIVEEDAERFLAAPDKFDFHEYRHMGRFIGMLESSETAEQLWRAIKGRGAFRHFKDTASRLGVLDQWYRYRGDAMRAFVVAWAEAHEIPFVDDLRRTTLP